MLLLSRCILESSLSPPAVSDGFSRDGGPFTKAEVMVDEEEKERKEEEEEEEEDAE